MGTDWERLANMTDEEAWQNALNDPDNPPLTDMELMQFTRAGAIPGGQPIEKYENLRKKRRLDPQAAPKMTFS